MTAWTDADLGRAFREATLVVRERHAIGPVIFRSTDGWEVLGSVLVGEYRREVRVVRPNPEHALVAFAEALEGMG